ESRAGAGGREPLARIVAWASAGVDPAYVGIGVVPATRKVLERTGLSLQDFDVIELNEAFAAQVLACDRELKLDHDKLNPNGGAIPLGHPIGMTGARVLRALGFETRAQGDSAGVATLCIRGGLGAPLALARARRRRRARRCARPNRPRPRAPAPCTCSAAGCSSCRDPSAGVARAHPLLEGTEDRSPRDLEPGLEAGDRLQGRLQPRPGRFDH